MRQAVLACMIGMGALPAVSHGAAMAQTLTGQVTSAQQGLMEGVLVSAKREGSTITTTVVTDEKGHYGFPASRLSPGHYEIAIRAVGYVLPGANAVDVTAKKAATDNLVLKKISDLHQLAYQLTNAEWLNSMPGPGAGCVDCHNVQRIVFSTHTAEEWPGIIQRMATYSFGSTPDPTPSTGCWSAPTSTWPRASPVKR